MAGSLRDGLSIGTSRRADRRVGTRDASRPGLWPGGPRRQFGSVCRPAIRSAAVEHAPCPDAVHLLPGSYPGLFSVCAVALVKERRVAITATSKLDVSLRRFPAPSWKYLTATALFGVGNSSNSFLILQTRDVGVSLAGTIEIYAAFNLVAALASYPAGFLSDRFGRRNILAVSLIIFLLTYMGFGLTRRVVLIACCFVLYGLYQGISRSVGKALAADLVPQALHANRHHVHRSHRAPRVSRQPRRRTALGSRGAHHGH